MVVWIMNGTIRIYFDVRDELSALQTYRIFSHDHNSLSRYTSRTYNIQNPALLQDILVNSYPGGANPGPLSGLWLILVTFLGAPKVGRRLWRSGKTPPQPSSSSRTANRLHSRYLW
jgi:hypothetical protein